jgi:hypothetical protein
VGGYRDIRSLKYADAKDEAVSSHISEDNIRHSEDTGDEENGLVAVCGSREDILQLSSR